MRGQVWALMIIGTDEDIAGYTIRHLLGEEIDKILIDLVPVEDNTAQIVRDLQAEYPEQIEIFPSDSVAIWGSRRMTRLANIAYERGIELVLPCDADELFYSLNGIPLADEIRVAQGWVWGVPVYMQLSASDDNEAEANPYRKMIHRAKEPLGLNKIALRFNPKVVIDEGNHGAKWLNGDSIPSSSIPLAMRHCPYRSPEQFARKVEITERAMEATRGYPQGWGVHYRVYADTLHRAGREALKEWFLRWFFLGAPNSEKQNMETFIVDPAPYKGDLCSG